jgi:hypothetical protein
LGKPMLTPKRFSTLLVKPSVKRSAKNYFGEHFHAEKIDNASSVRNA